MDAESRADSAGDLYRDREELDSGSAVKAKTKRPGMLGKLKNRLFGNKKRRTRSNDSKTGDEMNSASGNLKASSTTELTESGQANNSEMSMSVNSVFSPAEELHLRSSMIGMKNTSASLEALSSGSKMKSELERKLMNRRSLDDDGLPGSPIGTPTASDIMAHSNLMGHESHRFSRDSDGSLLSIGSSENEEDAFFKHPWKAAYTSAIRRPRRGVVSSDSESDDTLDFDAVTQTQNLNNAAAMHKRNVRPRHRAKARRVSAAPAQMPSVAEKKTLEIAHTFDQGERTPTAMIRNKESANASMVAVRRTDSGRTYGSPSVQRKSDPNVVNELKTKSPKPVARSVTSAANIPHKKPVPSEEHQAHQNELLCVFQRFKPSSTSSSTESKRDDSTPPTYQKPALIVTEPPTNHSKDGESLETPPPRPAKTVAFSGTPPLLRRAKPPAVQPRPKSMFPQQTRSKTQEIQGSNVEEALVNLSYSKSFNVHETTGNKPTDSFMRQKQPNINGDTPTSPEWAKLTKRKTWAVSEAGTELSRTSSESADNTTSAPTFRAVPVPRVKALQEDRPSSLLYKSEHSTDSVGELHTRLSQLNATQSSDIYGANDSPGHTPSPLDNPADSGRPMLYAAKVQPVRCERGPMVSNTRRTSAYDNVTMTGSYGPGYYADKKSPTGEEHKFTKETIVIPKPKHALMTSKTADDWRGAAESPAASAEPPWIASRKQRTASLKSTPTPAMDTSSSATPAGKSPWKSATLKERTTPSSMMSTSTECLDNFMGGQPKSRTLEISARRPNPMTVSETSAYSNELPPFDEPGGEEPKSFRDRLKMFQSK